jgi:hypothetical protein
MTPSKFSAKHYDENDNTPNWILLTLLPTDDCAMNKAHWESRSSSVVADKYRINMTAFANKGELRSIHKRSKEKM